MWLGQDLYAFQLQDIKVLHNTSLWFMKQEALMLQNDSEILQELISFTFMSGRLSKSVKQKLYSSADTQESSLEFPVLLYCRITKNLKKEKSLGRGYSEVSDMLFLPFSIASKYTEICTPDICLMLQICVPLPLHWLILGFFI